jgi:hypothetical protein
MNLVQRMMCVTQYHGDSEGSGESGCRWEHKQYKFKAVMEVGDT